MADELRRSDDRSEADGIRIMRTSGLRSSVLLLALAIALVGVALYLLFRPMLDTRSPQRPIERSGAIVTAPKRVVQPAARPFAPVRPAARDSADTRPGEAEEPVASPEEGEGEQVVADGEAEQDALEAPDSGDEPTGIALFPPPGTDPPKSGIIVPEGFELPPGYVRHYQTTDRGEQLPAILMFHPDYRPVDEHGEPIPIPENRIVPPEMVPPGLEVEILAVPEDLIPMIEEPDAGEDPGAR
jgi:hypothetical protein